MSQPIVRQSLDGVTATGPGSGVESLGHYHGALFVAVDGSMTSLTVQMEVSPDGETWSEVETGPGTPIEVTEADLTDDPTSGLSTACVKTPAVYARAVRARVTTYDGSGTVHGWIMLGGNSGQGRKPSARKGPVTDL